MKTLLCKILSKKSILLGRRVKIGLLGLGSTNRASLDILLKMQDVADITVRGAVSNRSEIPDTVSIIDTKSPFENISEDVIIPSPSVRREALKLPLYTEIITDYDLVFREHPKHLFTVSGSDGKSTTVTLSSLLLKDAIPDLFTGGNIGVPLWNTALGDAYLLELSSFTLRYTQPSGGRALLTNITPNHLDWHASFDEYVDTKLSLIRSADEPILNLTDAVSERAARETNAFCLIAEDMTHDKIRSLYRTEHTVTLQGDAIYLDGRELLRISEVRHKEHHNLINLASAIALSIGYTDRCGIQRVASSFTGLKERCERLELDSIHYISSSIDTTPDRTRTTLEGLGERVSLILGGRGKGLSLAPMRDVLLKYATRIAIYGEIADEMLGFIENDAELCEIPHAAFRHFDDAADFAMSELHPGDTLLLSPAATGYGEFEDYKERGRHFKEYVRSKHSIG